MFQLLNNIKKLHIMSFKEKEIKKNLGINEDIVEYCKKKILDKNCLIYKFNMYYYCEIDNLVITINASNFMIISINKIK